MKAENDRLRRDNERFVRLIDSGEWGRGRVAELTRAGKLTACVEQGSTALAQPQEHDPRGLWPCGGSPHNSVTMLAHYWCSRHKLLCSPQKVVHMMWTTPGLLEPCKPLVSSVCESGLAYMAVSAIVPAGGLTWPILCRQLPISCMFKLVFDTLLRDSSFEKNTRQLAHMCMHTGISLPIKHRSTALPRTCSMNHL